jgi:hypothetical protein
MAADGTLQLLVGAVAAALEPLQASLAAGDARGLIAEMGLSLPASLDGQPAFSSAASAAITAVEALAGPAAMLASAAEAEDVGAILSATVDLLGAVSQTIAALDALAGALGSLSGSLGGVSSADVTAFAGTFGEKLLEHVVLDYLGGYRPVLLRILALLGIVDVDVAQPDGSDPAKIAYQRHDLNLPALGDLLGNPAGHLSTMYGWNTPTLQAGALLSRLRDLMVEFGAAAVFDPATSTLSALPFGFAPTSGSAPPGISAFLGRGISDGAVLALTSLMPAVWTLQLTAQGALDAGVELRLLPPGQLEVHAAASVDGSLQLGFARTPDPGQRLTIIGIPGIATLDAASIGTSVGAQFHWDSGSGAARGAFVVSTSITGGKFTVGAANADGFVAALLSGLDIKLDFDFQLGWAGDRGFFVGGNAGIGTTIGVHTTIGPFTVDSVHLELTASGSGLALETSVTGSGTLGPITASVDRIGASTDLGFAPGNLGPAQLDVGFKPPAGLGIVVDAGVVTGGGYISYDPVRGEYAGVLELSLLGISIKAIGVLDTKLPDGSSGFSFLIILTFDLPPIQLGFGFTLNAVGGLCGINRTMVLDALRDAMRAHHLDSILFPPDPVQDAAQIISDIRTIFPPAQDRYVFGPMLEVGWGTPSLITLELGVILEVPDPVRLAILGRFHMALPDDDTALILVQIDILGTLDFGAKQLSIDGTLYDSHIVLYEMFGDMALRLNWGDNADFAVSIGGFHPQYSPPTGFPVLRRLTVAIGAGDLINLGCTAYLAVTSNSFQFGAAVELSASAGGFGVHGHLGFDALFMVSPFSFDVDFSAGMDVQYDGVTLLGIQLDAELSGPSPWHVHGSASFTILIVSISAGIDLSWGDDNAITLPSTAVLPLLHQALTAPSSWSAQLPDGAEQAVSLRGLPPSETDVIVHPMGSLTVREKIVPLDVPVDKFGDSTPSDGGLFAIAGVDLGGNPAAATPVQDAFARGQFQQLTDDQKISTQAFEQFDSGMLIGDPSVRAGHDAPRTVAMQWRYIPDPTKVSILDRVAPISDEMLTAATALGAGARSLVKNSGTSRYTGPGMKSILSTDPVQYVVASTEDLTVRGDIAPAAGTTNYSADAALAAHLAANPQDAGRLQVVPRYEAVGGLAA